MIGDAVVAVFLAVYIVVFKQKTACEMRISDWSSDVCSSDLWVAGAYYYYNKEKYDPFVQNFGYFGPDNTTFISNLYLTSKSYAFFAQGTVRLFDETRLTAGARWTHEHRTMTGSVLESDLIDGVTTAPYVCEGGFCGAVTQSAYTQSKHTWRISLDQKFSTDIMGYVSYNHGFMNGGFTPPPPLSSEDR